MQVVMREGSLRKQGPLRNEGGGREQEKLTKISNFEKCAQWLAQEEPI
jgi:hypothetical protein